MISSDSINKIPPQNLEAERSVLGSMLIMEEAVFTGVELLNPSDFYRTAHRIIFEVIAEIFNKGDAVDIITVSESLRKKKQLKNIGGADYLEELIDSVATAANISYYATIVKDKSILRKLIKVSSKAITDSFQETTNAKELLEKSEQSIYLIRETSEVEGLKPMSDMVEDTIDTIEKICKRDGEVSGISTGFKSLDLKLAGLHKGNLIIVAGRPSMGKTSFGLNIVQYIGLEKQIPVAIFSLEMSDSELMMRMLCSESKVDLSRVRDGYVGTGEWAALTAAAGRIKESKIFIDDSSSITVLEMKARARRLKSKYGNLGLIVVDYIQLMHGSGHSESRQQEISYISRSLKILAKDLEIPVIAMSQLSRAPEMRGSDARPRLSDLRESGAIEQDADVVIFLYRPSYYMKPEDIQADNENIANIIIGKQRNGPVGQIDMLFQKEYTRFRDLTLKQE